MDTLSGKTSQNYFVSSGKGSILKGKNLLPRGANSFLLEYPSQIGTGMQESKKGVKIIVPHKYKVFLIELRFYGPVNPLGSC